MPQSGIQLYRSGVHGSRSLMLLHGRLVTWTLSGFDSSAELLLILFLTGRDLLSVVT